MKRLIRVLLGLIVGAAVSRANDAVWCYDQGAGERFEGSLRATAVEGGYAEIPAVPAVPVERTFLRKAFP